MKSTTRPLFFLVHVAKTGGNAIQHFLRSRLAPDEVMIRIEVDRPQHFRNIVAKLDGVRFLSGHLAMDEVDRYFSAFAPVRLLSLRDPIDRTISNLRFWLSLDRGLLSGEFLKIRERLEQESPSAFLRSLQSSLEVHNFLDLQVRYMNTFEPPDLIMTESHSDSALARLDQCSSIFMAEHMFESVLMFCEKWRMRPPRSIPLVNTKNQADLQSSDACNELRQAAQEACSLDMKFFAVAQQRFAADWQAMISIVLARSVVGAEQFRGLQKSEQLQLLRAEIERAYEESLRSSNPVRHISVSNFVDSLGFDHGLWNRQVSKIGLTAPGEKAAAGVNRVLWVTDAKDNRLYLGALPESKCDVAVRIACAMSIRSVVTARLSANGVTESDQLALDENNNVYLTAELRNQKRAGLNHIQLVTEPCAVMQEIDDDFKFGYASDMAPASIAIDLVDIGVAPQLNPLKTGSLLTRAHDLIAAGFQVQFNILNLPLNAALEEVPWIPAWGSAAIRYSRAENAKYSVAVTNDFPRRSRMPIVAVMSIDGEQQWLACPAQSREIGPLVRGAEFICLFGRADKAERRFGIMIDESHVSYPPMAT